MGSYYPLLDPKARKKPYFIRDYGRYWILLDVVVVAPRGIEPLFPA